MWPNSPAHAGTTGPVLGVCRYHRPTAPRQTYEALYRARVGGRAFHHYQVVVLGLHCFDYHLYR